MVGRFGMMLGWVHQQSQLGGYQGTRAKCSTRHLDHFKPLAADGEGQPVRHLDIGHDARRHRRRA